MAEIVVKLLPRPLLSFQAVTFDPETPTVLESAPSNHKIQFAISKGWNMRIVGGIVLKG